MSEYSQSAVATAAGARYRFGSFTFDAESGELRRHDRRGDPQRLPPQPARLLQLLIEAEGKLVGRDEIRAALWPDTQVDFDTSLHFCVRQIRNALGDSASSPAYIETLPRRGYRLIPEVERPPRREGRHRVILLGLALAVVALLALAWGFHGGWRAGREAQIVRIAIMPFQPPEGMSGFGDWRPIAEWILEELDRIAGKRAGLIGPTSTVDYGYGQAELLRLANDYDVQYIVNGRFIESEEGPRVLAELIRVSDGVHMWVRAYEDPAAGHSIGREIGENVARELSLAPAEPSDLEFAELSDDVVVVTSRPFAANSLLVRTADGAVILVDTPFTPHDTEELIDWARDRWGAYPSFAVNSHWHLDASGGNQVLLAHGAEVIASKRTTEILQQRGAGMKASMLEYFAGRDPSTRVELETFRPTPASRVIEVGERTVLQLGGEEVWLIYPGPSHSADSIGVYFPERRLLYGGCAVRSDGKFINRDEADFSNWADAVERFAALEPVTVIPGHGNRFDPQMLQETIEGARRIAAGGP